MTYSRRQSVEEKNNRKRALGYILLSVGFALFMLFYGIPLLARLANIAYDFRKGSEPIEITDNTPPPPPRIDTLPGATKDSSINISGSSESGSIVIIDINGDIEEVVADNNGRFSLSVLLDDGDNFIKASAKDSSNNISHSTETLTVVLDIKPPLLEITSPTDGAEFSGSSGRSIRITGTSEANSKVQVNDRLALVNSDGSFSYTYQLSEGENIISVKSTDGADNTTETSLKVIYFP